MRDPHLLASLASRWHAIEPLLDEALDMAPADRARWLAALPSADAELRELLARLLDAQAGGRAEAPLDPLPQLAEPAPPSGEAPGQTVGPYRLLRELGRGGMGAVWLAVRDDRAPLRQVALKLPRLAWGTDLARRMARERDILASLEHPNIARLYDAGVDAAGRPWLAMEYVDGAPIDRHCASQRLGVRARVELLLQAAGSVAYAHRRLVVHRDLKPSNILVGADGAVRLVDFGIARLVAGDADTAGGATAATLETALALTPEYASPEQLQGQPLSTATDIYSLGVVTYELLCGRRPFAHLPAHGLARAQAVTTRDPPPPSSVTLDAAPAAERGGLSPRELSRALAGDLDAILQRALAPAPEDRYASAQAFADDLARWRDGHPVQARAPRAGYVLRKFVARHRGAVAAGSAAVLLLVVSSGIAITSALQAREQSQRAQASRDFLIGLFERANPDLRGGRDATARELLEAAQANSGGLPGNQRQEVLQTVAKLWAHFSDGERAARAQAQLSSELEAVGGVALAASRVEEARIAQERWRFDDVGRYLDAARAAAPWSDWPPALRALADEQQGWHFLHQGMHAPAREAFTRARTSAQAARDAEREVYALYGLAHAQQQSGLWREARSTLGELSNILGGAGSLAPRTRLDLSYAVATLLYSERRFYEGWPFIQRAIEEGRSLYADTVSALRHRTYWLRFCLMLGRVGPATEWLAANDWTDAQLSAFAPEEGASWLALTAVAWARAGDAKRAADLLKRAESFAVRAPPSQRADRLLRIRHDAARAALALDDPIAALTHLAPLLQHAAPRDAALEASAASLAAVALARNNDMHAAVVQLAEATRAAEAVSGADAPANPALALLSVNGVLLRLQALQPEIEAGAPVPELAALAATLVDTQATIEAAYGPAHAYSVQIRRLLDALRAAPQDRPALFARMQAQSGAFNRQLVW